MEIAVILLYKWNLNGWKLGTNLSGVRDLVISMYNEMVNPTKSKLAAVKTEALKAESIKSFMLHLYIQKK